MVKGERKKKFESSFVNGWVDSRAAPRELTRLRVSPLKARAREKQLVRRVAYGSHPKRPAGSRNMARRGSLDGRKKEVRILNIWLCEHRNNSAGRRMVVTLQGFQS
ncbi:MAG: hypothetical protein BJ554DRAFT_359 [Olpidium bornovanus]|uniref:Uncharacterized protein n=1 Tax=Olpidium bornovanus TaxID=278681 RepID=A0A8H7ZTV0_9FUNG|nr:MAG: hypothetical protein BJ554DRAFT_359 [Olpidium bornovanus]